MNIKYRPDIDGLRAIAVLSVIAYHLNSHWLHGGFIGVDVFFVISGYLITKIIYTDIVNNQFSFKVFYQRRINRILPTFFIVMLATSIGTWYVLLPDEFMLYLKSLKSTIYFWENMFFAKNTGGYWDIAAEKMPILHTWSLAVEEQFYILLPFLLLFVCGIQFKTKRKLLTFNKTSLLIVLAVIDFASFYVAQVSPSSLFLTEYNYYSLFTARAGELLIGSIIGIISVTPSKSEEFNKRPLWINNILSLIGFLAMILSIVFISKNNLFPSFIALIPTIGAALIIYFYDSRTYIARFLSLKPVVFIGKISFSMYLWHWPLIVLTKQYLFVDDFDTAWQYLFVISLTFILSLFTYFLVEKPCRKYKKSFKFSFIVYYLIPSLLIFGIYKSYPHIYKHQDGQIIKGKNDFLFLGNNYENIIKKLTLLHKPEAKKIDLLDNLLKNLTNVASSTNTKVALLIGTDKSRIYSEYLPDSIIPAKDRYIDFYLEKLIKNKDLIIYDSYNDLVAAKNNKEFLYYRTDTHWNNKGAFIAYKNFLQQLHLPVPNIIFKSEQSHYGDLVYIGNLDSFPLHNDDNFDAILDKSSMKCEIINVSKGSFGNLEKCFNDNALVNKHIWVIGDSFSNALRIYLQATFNEVDFLGHWMEKLPVIADDIKNAKIKPDMLIIVRVERSF